MRLQKDPCDKKTLSYQKWMQGVPVVVQGKQSQLGPMRLQVRSLASLSGSEIQCCQEQWCRSQTQLGSQVAVAVALTQPLAWEPPHATGAGPLQKKQKKKKKKNQSGYSPTKAISLVFFPSIDHFHLEAGSHQKEGLTWAWGKTV